MKILFRSVYGVLLFALIAGCEEIVKQIKQPALQLEAVRIRGLSLQAADLDFLIQISNPNPLGLTVNRLQYQLEVQDKWLLSGTAAEGVQIEANARHSVTLPLRLSFNQVFQSLSDISGQKALSYRFSGRADLGYFAIPFEKRGQIQLPSLPSVRITEFRLRSIRLTDLTAELMLEVQNDNAFPLQFSGLQYQLTVGNEKWIQAEAIKPMQVAANNRMQFPLAVRLDLLQTANWADRLRRGKDLPLDFSGEFRFPGAEASQILPIKWQGITKILRN